MRAAEGAYPAVFGRKPVYMCEGGYIPVVGEFQSILNMETIMMGVGLPGDQIDSPNECFYLPHFYKGIQISIEFLRLLGGWRSSRTCGFIL